ncbi:MAG: CoA transferase subunit A [Bradymonadales bacterium]|nr:CoA transferase subunit A [Bradymonadales bacterium]
MGELKSGIKELVLKPDPDGARAWMREHKSMALVDKRMTEAEAVRRFVQEGDYLATELYGSCRAPMSITREIIRQGLRNLNIAGQGVMETELLIAAGCIRNIDLTYQGWEVYGISPVLRRAAEGGKVNISEWSNASLAWRLKAAALGVPFIPVRSMLGTDTFKYSAAKEITCPFTGMKLCALPATMVDVGIIHAHRADKYGNCQIDGISGFAIELARASKKLLVSVEEIIDNEEIRTYPERTVIPWFLVDALVVAPFGSHPGEMNSYYWRDQEHLKEYLDLIKTEQGTQEYLKRTIHDLPDHETYVQTIGKERLAALVEARTMR